MRLERETGAHVAFINLSGGVGIPYLPGQQANDIRAIGEGVHAAYDEILVPAGMGDVAICTEMGRFMMGPYGCLVTRPSTRSTSTRTISAWTHAPSTSFVRPCTAPTTTLR